LYLNGRLGTWKKYFGHFAAAFCVRTAFSRFGLRSFHIAATLLWCCCCVVHHAGHLCVHIFVSPMKFRSFCGRGIPGYILCFFFFIISLLCRYCCQRCGDPLLLLLLLMLLMLPQPLLEAVATAAAAAAAADTANAGSISTDCSYVFGLLFFLVVFAPKWSFWYVKKIFWPFSCCVLRMYLLLLLLLLPSYSKRLRTAVVPL